MRRYGNLKVGSVFVFFQPGTLVLLTFGFEKKSPFFGKKKQKPFFQKKRFGSQQTKNNCKHDKKNHIFFFFKNVDVVFSMSLWFFSLKPNQPHY